jgi:glutamine synthetase
MEVGNQLKKLPMSLDEALDRLEATEVFMWQNRDEWERFLSTASDWDVEN